LRDPTDRPPLSGALTPAPVPGNRFERRSVSDVVNM
jgi:hypothetical protein